jgi:hypothetical protein
MSFLLNNPRARRARLAMSTNSLGYTARTAAISDFSAVQGGELPQLDEVDIRVCGLSGEEIMRTKLAVSTLGQEVQKIVAEKLPSRPGARFLLYQGVSQLMLNKTLQEQGIVGQEATLTYTFCSTDLCAAWSFVQRQRPSQEEPLALEGLTCIEGAITSHYLRNLPETLQSLAFGQMFNQNLEGVTFPSNLQSLTFGHMFNQSLEGVTFPSNLQMLTFGRKFNQNLESVTFPNNLQSLTFGEEFNQKLERVAFPSILQSLNLGTSFIQNLEAVTCLSSLRKLVVQDVVVSCL